MELPVNYRKRRRKSTAEEVLQFVWQILRALEDRVVKTESLSADTAAQFPFFGAKGGRRTRIYFAVADFDSNLIRFSFFAR